MNFRWRAVEWILVYHHWRHHVELFRGLTRWSASWVERNIYLKQLHRNISRSQWHWWSRWRSGMEARSCSDISPSLHTVLLRVLETKPREVELSVTKSDDGHWAAYITELVNLRNLKPVEHRWLANTGPVTRITLPPLEPRTPYRVRVRPVQYFTEPNIWIDEATFNTRGEHTTSVGLFFSRNYSGERPYSNIFPANRWLSFWRHAHRSMRSVISLIFFFPRYNSWAEDRQHSGKTGRIVSRDQQQYRLVQLHGQDHPTQRPGGNHYISPDFRKRHWNWLASTWCIHQVHRPRRTRTGRRDTSAGVGQRGLIWDAAE